MANIYSEKTADWTYHNVTRLDIHSFRFGGIGAYATTTIVGEEMGQELSGEISFRGFISPIQNSLSQGLRCRLDIYSKQSPAQLDWEIESHFVYIKGDRNGVINQKVSVRSGAYDHIDLRLEVLLDAELSLDDTIDLTSFVVHDAGFIGELNIIKDKIEEGETGLSALEQETLNLFNVISGSMGFYPTVVEQEDGKFISYVHDKPKLEDSMVIAVMTEAGWASTITGWNDGEPDWSYGVTFGGSLVMNVVSAVGVNADWVRAGELIGGKVHFNLDEGTFLIGNSDEDYQLYFNGTDLKLGIDTSVSWGDIGGKPTYLGANYIWSPEIYGGNIYGGTITSDSTIDVTTDLAVGHNIYMAAYDPLAEGTLYLPGGSFIEGERHGDLTIGANIINVAADGGTYTLMDMNGNFYADYLGGTAASGYVKNSVTNITSNVSTASGVTGVNARVFGKVVTVRFLYQPTTTGFIQNVITMPDGYRPPTQMAMAIATTQSTADAPTNIMAYLGSNGAVTVVTSGTLPTYELLFTVTYIAT